MLLSKIQKVLSSNNTNDLINIQKDQSSISIIESMINMQKEILKEYCLRNNKKKKIAKKTSSADLNLKGREKNNIKKKTTRN